MATADIAWTCPVGRVGVETKTIEDLAQSHQEGRLDDQLCRLHQEFAVPVLLLTTEGVGDQWVDNLFIGRQLRGIIVARCVDSAPYGLVNRVVSLINYLDRPPNRLIRPRTRHFPYMGKMTEQAEVVFSLLSSVKGIRDKAAIAERLATTKSLREVFAMTANDWRASGFTKLMAERLERKLYNV